MRQKLTYRYIKRFIEQQGYTLLSNQYVNAHVKLLICCSSQHKYEVTWNNFKTGYRCPHCAGQVVNSKHIERYIKQHGYQLLSDHYVNINSRITVKCSNDHCYKVIWKRFRRGDRCVKCKSINRKKNYYQQIRRYVEQQGYKFLSNKYTNRYDKFLFECSKGHRYIASWANFQQGHRCSRCKQSKGEEELYNLLQLAFPDYKITRQDNLRFLERQTVDFAISELKLAFEYDGKQHFEPVQYGGISIEEAEQRLNLQKRRDSKKQKLCQKNGHTLIRLRYDQDLQKEIKEIANGYSQ